MVDDLLRTALDFGVAALHAVEIQRRRVAARRHGTGGTAAHADAHARAAELHQQRAGADAAQPAGDHDGLVIAALHTRHRHLEDTEVAAQVGPSELVVEGRAAERALGHDLQGAGNVHRLAEGLLLPRLVGAGQVQVADAETRQPGFRLGATPGGAFVANLAAGTGAGARVGADGGGMVVRFHLHQHMRDLVARAVHRRVGEALRQPARDRPAFHDCGVVVVGDDGVLRRDFLGVANHPEHRQRLLDAVDGELRVEDLVAAMFAVGLREHHQLDIARVAAELLKGGHQVVDFVIAERQAEFGVGRQQRRSSVASARTEHLHMRQRRSGPNVEEMRRGFALESHALGHAVMQHGGHGGALVGVQRLGGAQQRAFQEEAELGDAFQPVQRQADVARDVAGLAGPRRDGAQARHHHHRLANRSTAERVAVLQQCAQLVDIGAGRFGVEGRPVHEACNDASDARANGLQTDQQSLVAEGRERSTALEVHQMKRRGGHAVPGCSGKRGGSRRF